MTPPPSITLRQLAYFAAEEGSLTAAAERIHLSQSALSTAVSELERLLDVQLFIRHARGLSLTRDGERVLAESRALLGDADALQRNAGRLQHELTGSIVVGCHPTILSSLLPMVIAEFTARHPRITLEIKEAHQDDLLTWLSTGRLNLAIAYDYHLDSGRLPPQARPPLSSGTSAPGETGVSPSEGQPGPVRRAPL